MRFINAPVNPMGMQLNDEDSNNAKAVKINCNDVNPLTVVKPH